MTDKTQIIKQEIERQIEEGKVKCQESQENNDYESFVAWSEHVATCGKLLVFINSLPEEHVSENRINECLNWDKDWGCSTSPMNKCDTCPRAKWVEVKEKKNYNERYKRIAQTDQFKESFCDKSLGKEEPASEDLDEEAKKFYTEIECYPPSLQQYSNHIEKAFKAGAEWQKQQMMNDVFIDDYIVHDGRIEVEGDPLPSVEPIILLPYPKFKPNDKVKIIIVKDDQQ